MNVFSESSPNVSPSICIVGNLNLDLMITGIKRLPQWGEEQFGVDRKSVTSGQAGYMAIAAASLGAQVSIIGVIGDDEDGGRIRKDLADHGVDCSGVTAVSGRATGLTVAIIREDGERCFVSDVGASSAFDARLIDLNWQIVAKAKAMAIVGIFNTPSLTLDAVHSSFRRARQSNVFTVFDTGWDSAGWPAATRKGTMDILSSVDLFLPNEDEALAITGLDRVEKALDMLSAACAGLVVIKRGAKGAVSRLEGEMVEVAARPVENANAVGAGDVYDAAIVTALQRRADPLAAMRFAGKAAEHYVARWNDRYPTLADLN